MTTKEKLEREVATIGDLSREELAKRWVKTYGCPPPKGVKRALLERSAAWHLQAKRLGGLSAEARKVLRQAGRAGPDARAKHTASVQEGDAETARQIAVKLAISAKPRPGTRLLREWNGRTYMVDVVEDGFVLDGESYRSLSAIALRITGARWSGPRFFGL